MTPSFLNALGSLARPSTVVSGRPCSSLANLMTDLLAREVHRSELVVERARSLRGGELPLRAHRVLVDHRLRQAVLHREVLGGHRHRQVAVAVGERAPERVLHRRRPPEHGAPAHSAKRVGGLRHALGAADQRDLRLARQHLQRGLHDRLEARAAEAVDGDCGGLLRHARAQADVAREVDRVCGGLLHVAEDDVVDIVRVDLGLGERGLGGVDAEVGGALVLEGAAEGPEGGPLGGEEDDLGGERLHRVLLCMEVWQLARPDGSGPATRAT